MADRLVIAVSGPPKNGKSHFSLTAPEPIYVQSIDRGLDGVIQKFHSDKEIYVSNYGIEISHHEAGDEAAMAAAADPVWAQWCADYFSALDRARTIVWDQETDAWELIRLARFGILNPPTGRDRGNVWGPVNTEYRRLIRSALERDINFILIRRVKERYVNDKKSGTFEPAGFKDIDSMVQVVCTAERDHDQFSLLVTDCRHNPGMNGQVVPVNDFSMLKDMVME